MAYDELELDRIGDRKTAVFFIISDTTQTYNFLVALAFSQMFNLLCERADNVHGGRLPHHVRVLWDEAANTGQVPQLEKIVAVIRSREISLTLFYQQLAQCKAIYDSEHFGLGLYICKLLCEHHNGYLKIENTASGAKVSAYFKSPAL